MTYIHRSAERKFKKMSSFFKAVIVTGARQVGKTTMLHHLAEGSNRTYVTLDNALARNLAKTDPVLFFQTYKPPILIDEVQKAPELFEQIKIFCDESNETGRFWMTGSQHFKMMQNVRETLAGRVGILELHSLSKNEKEGITFANELDFSLECLLERQARALKNDVNDVYEHIWRGGMPQVVYADSEQRQEYFNSYVNTYLMRDVTDFGGITDALRFGKFLAACAALVSQQVNYKTVSDTAEISQPTAKEWLRLLEGMGIIYLLAPYANNALSRLAKTPKLYFCDSGLAAYLSMWTSKDTLMHGAASGYYFENFVVMELLKNYGYSPERVNMSYLRDSNKKEIDVFVERGNQIHPLEIKKAASPNIRDVKKFDILDKAEIDRGHGGIVCMSEEVVPIDDKNCIIPCNLI